MFEVDPKHMLSYNESYATSIPSYSSLIGTRQTSTKNNMKPDHQAFSLWKGSEWLYSQSIVEPSDQIKRK